MICSQAGTLWSDLAHVKQTIRNCQTHFPLVKYAVSSVPTYPNGQIGYLVAALNPDLDLARPAHTLDELGLRYYSPEVHQAAFVLPACFKKELANA